jgi:hypothetical protein
MGPNCFSSPLISRVIRPECPRCLAFNLSDFRPGAIPFQGRNRPSTDPRTKAQRAPFRLTHRRSTCTPLLTPTATLVNQRLSSSLDKCSFALSLEFPFPSEAPTGYKENLVAIYRIDSKLQDREGGVLRCMELNGWQVKPRPTLPRCVDAAAPCAAAPLTRRSGIAGARQRPRPRGATVTARLRLSCLTGASPAPGGSWNVQKKCFSGSYHQFVRLGRGPLRD